MTHNGKIFTFTILLLAMYNSTHSMETTSWKQTAILQEWNHHATLLYEQAFFCELLLAIVETRRTDEFHADVLKARDAINVMVLNSWDQNSLPFDEESSLCEMVYISRIYYTFRYLTGQKTYTQLKNDPFPSHARLPILCSLLMLLEQFAGMEEKDKQGQLSHICNQKELLLQITDNYRSKSKFLREEYQKKIKHLRDLAMADPHNIGYIFHKYLDKPKKILPISLNSDESTLPTINDLKYTPLYSQAFTNLPWEEEEPWGQNTCESSREIGDLLFSYDFQEYWLAKVAAVLHDQEELMRVAHDFKGSYVQNCEKLNSLFLHDAHKTDPHYDAWQQLAPLSALGKHLALLLTEKSPEHALPILQCLAGTIENSLTNRL